MMSCKSPQRFSINSYCYIKHYSSTSKHIQGSTKPADSQDSLAEETGKDYTRGCAATTNKIDQSTMDNWHYSDGMSK
ncbi:uncharacterized protein J3R85_009599 [Psidium guajava]|nr:uncharacterized protein J3R85_009599 [Psidium guajava]